MQTSSVEEIAKVQVEAIMAHGKKLGRPLSIVEAGCGQNWLIDLTGLEYRLTGIDLDPAALELRKTKFHDLDDVICGDLCSVQLSDESCDVVYSSFVLEHIPRADIALQNFVKWLRPGGLLILRLPDPAAARPFLANTLPFRVHIWYFRSVYGLKDAGKPGHAPYPTFYHPVIEPGRLKSFLAERGVNLLACYGDGFHREGSTWLRRMILTGIVRMTALLSMGKLTSDHTNLLYIAAKVESSHAR